MASDLLDSSLVSENVREVILRRIYEHSKISLNMVCVPRCGSTHCCWVQ